MDNRHSLIQTSIDRDIPVSIPRELISVIIDDISYSDAKVIPNYSIPDRLLLSKIRNIDKDFSLLKIYKVLQLRDEHKKVVNNTLSKYSNNAIFKVARRIHDDHIVYDSFSDDEVLIDIVDLSGDTISYILDNIGKGSLVYPTIHFHPSLGATNIISVHGDPARELVTFLDAVGDLNFHTWFKRVTGEEYECPIS
jgi:hypothetical protein